MQNETIEVETNALVTLPNVQMTKTRLVIPEDTSFSDWEDIGKKLKNVEGAVQFWIGDWINFGERKWGDKYQFVHDELGFSYDYISQIASVSKKFPGNSVAGNGIEGTPTRHENLSFSHHVEVATIPGPVAERLLIKAETENLSKRELRIEVREWQAAHSMQPPAHIPETVFSWAKDEEGQAGFDALQTVIKAFNRYANDKRDRDTARYFADMLVAKAEICIKEMKKGLEVWR
jgi:hypothetical protein